MTDYDLYTRPFLPEEHGFVGGDNPDSGNAYILKSALRRRLTEIDKKWRLGTPQLMAVDSDLVVMTGELIVEGASRTGVGTGKILNMKAVRENGKVTGYEPVAPFELTREKNKAFKSAASDILPRACLEYNIGAYLKEKPKHVTNRAMLTKWLADLTPKTEQHWSDDPVKVAWLVNDSIEKLLLAPGQTDKDLLKLLGKDNFRDYPTCKEHTVPAVKEAAEKRQREAEAAKDAAFGFDVLPPVPPVRSGSLNVNSATIEDRTAVFTTKGSMVLRVLIKNLIAMLEPNGDARDNKKQERWLESVRPGLWKDGQSVTFPELRLWFTALREANYALHVTSIDVAVDIPANGGTPAGDAIFPPANGGSEAVANAATQSNGTPVQHSLNMPRREAPPQWTDIPPDADALAAANRELAGD